MALNEQEKAQFDLLVQSLGEKTKLDRDSGGAGDDDGAPFLPSRRAIRNRLVYGVLLFLIGLGTLIGSVAVQTTWVGVAAFALMLGGSILVYQGYRYSRFYGDIYVPIRLPWRRP